MDKLVDGCAYTFAASVIALGLLGVIALILMCGATTLLIIRVAQSIGG